MTQTNRETKELTSTGGHKVVIKTYLTGRESNEAKAVLFAGITTTAEAGERPKVPLSNIMPHERKTLELLVVSFDGTTESPLDLVEDLPSDEYEALVSDIKKESKAFLGQTK